MKTEERGVKQLTCQGIGVGMLVVCSTTMLSGCVVLEEKYNAEKARSLNFQRLLAQEEKRTAELDSEVKRTKRELSEFEARNRELSAQVQSAREQMGRLQEEAEAIRESALLERKAMEDMRKMSAAKPKKTDVAPPQTAGSIDAGLLEMPKEAVAIPDAAPAAKAAASTVHVVRPGETLFRISRQYGIPVDKLKKMNKLPDDIIEVGQKLIVGTE